MQRALGLVLATVAAVGCGTTIDEGFGVALTIRFDAAVGDAEVASVRRFQFVASGDENDTAAAGVKRTSGAQRIERIVYRPRAATRSLTLEVSGLDGSDNLIAIGTTPTLTLSPGKTTVAEVLLTLPASPDMGPVDDLSIPDEPDLSEGPPDLGPTDLRRPVPTTIAFPQPSPFPVGPGTAVRFMTAGLIDKDAVPDVVVTRYSPTLGYSTLLSDGQGHLGTPASQSTSAEPTSIAIGDFNGDGVGDYAVVVPVLTLYLSNMSGMYSAMPMGISGTSVAVADFTNDGKLDLAVGLTASPYGVVVMLGDGAGGFDNPTFYPTSNQVVKVGVADFNGDSRPDIAAMTAPGVQILANTGVRPVEDMGPTPADLVNTTGPLFTLGTPVTNSLGAVTKMEIADVRGDAAPEILVGQGNYVYLMDNTAGTLQPGVQIPTGSTTIATFATGDLDGDNKSEIIGWDVSYPTLIVVRAKDATTFSTVRYGIATNVVDLMMRDFNGDGAIDLAILDSTPRVLVHLGASGDFPTLPAYSRVNGSFGASTTGDFDGDGRLDVAVVGTSPANVTFFLNRGAGAWLPLPVTLSATQLAVGDFNSDGHPDVVASNTTNLSLLMNSGSMSPDGGSDLFTVKGPYGSAGISAVTVGSFNKDTDSRDDIAYADAMNQKVGIMINDGTGGFPSATTYSACSTPNSIVAADLNNDTRLDVAVSCTTSNNISVLLDTGTGILGVAQPYGASTATSHNGIRAGHFNTDDKLDLVFGATQLGVVLNAGNGSFPALVTPTADGVTSGMLLVDDFNIDDKHDIIYVGGSPQSLNLLLGTRMGSFQPVQRFSTGGATVASIVSGDFDGDGLKDVVMIHSYAGYGGPVFMRNQSR